MEMIAEQTSETLQEQFVAAVSEHRYAMYRAARVLFDNDADAEDTVSEAILRAWQAFGKLRNPQSVKSWLLKITIRCAYENRRKGTRLVYTDDVAPLAGGANDQYSWNHNLWEIVCQLPEKFRVATVLYYYEDMSTAEIAQTLGVRAGTVRSRLARARTLLRSLLEKEEESQ